MAYDFDSVVMPKFPEFLGKGCSAKCNEKGELKLTVHPDLDSIVNDFAEFELTRKQATDLAKFLFDVYLKE